MVVLGTSSVSKLTRIKTIIMKKCRNIFLLPQMTGRDLATGLQKSENKENISIIVFIIIIFS